MIILYSTKNLYNFWVITYILYMIKTQRRSSAGVLQRLSGESFIVTVDEAKKSVNVETLAIWN